MACAGKRAEFLGEILPALGEAEHSGTQPWSLSSGRGQLAGSYLVTVRMLSLLMEHSWTSQR